MQTLILANGILGTRMVRLSDDSELTELALADMPLKQMVNEMFLRILSRPPTLEEQTVMTNLLADTFASRKVKGATKTDASIQSDNRVSWSNHLSAEATVIRMEEERALRLGAQTHDAPRTQVPRAPRRRPLGHRQLARIHHGALMTRRDLLATAAALSAAPKQIPKGKADACILLWLGGGAAHIDTFDPKRKGDGKKIPGSAYNAINTAVKTSNSAST